MFVYQVCLHLYAKNKSTTFRWFLLTDLADELSELVQVALSIRSDAQLPDAAVKLFCSLKWILQQKNMDECSWRRAGRELQYCAWWYENFRGILQEDETVPRTENLEKPLFLRSVAAKVQQSVNWTHLHRLWNCSHLLIRLVLCLPEEADVFDESRLDVFVVHKLAEDVKLLPQELVGEIHLKKKKRGDV